MTRKVSVVIPCYNQGHLLADAIQSSLDQDYPEKEVIVVNDGSPDGTRAVAGAFSGSIVYVEQPNRGLSAARNAGIRAGTGEYVALLDSDDTLLPGSLTLRAGYLDTHPTVGLVCGDAVLFDDTGTLGLKSARSGRPRHPENFRWETVRYCATPSTMMIRRACLEEVGGFDETVEVPVRRPSPDPERGTLSPMSPSRARIPVAEDWSLCVQLSLRHDLAYLDQPLIRFRLHPGNVTRNVEWLNAINRHSIARMIRSPSFADYPAHFRAQLLFYRFAAAWRVEPKHVALRYFARAVATDPTQLPHGLGVIRLGLANTLRRVGRRLRFTSRQAPATDR